MHPRGFQLLSLARGPQSTRARGGDREVMTCHALVQSWFLCLGYQISTFILVRERCSFFLNKICAKKNNEKKNDREKSSVCLFRYKTTCRQKKAKKRLVVLSVIIILLIRWMLLLTTLLSLLPLRVGRR